MRAIAILAAIAMLASVFLPWVSGLGQSFAPWDVLRHLDLNQIQNLIGSDQIELTVYLASLVLAALFVVLAVLGPALRLLAVLAGGLPVAAIAYGVLAMRNQLAGLDPRLGNAASLTDLWSIAQNTLGYGAWGWGFGALVLLLAGLVGFARR